MLAGPGTPLLAPLPVGAFFCVRAAQRAPAIVRGAIILLSLLATAVLLPLLLTMDGVLRASPWMLALPALIALVDAGAGAYDACTATSREVGRSPPSCAPIHPLTAATARPSPTGAPAPCASQPPRRPGAPDARPVERQRHVRGAGASAALGGRVLAPRCRPGERRSGSLAWRATAPRTRLQVWLAPP